MLCVIFLPVTSAVDGDGDGVDDSVDICRFAAGNATSTSGLGCPDSNGDGLADFEQAVTHNWDDSVIDYIDTNTISSEVYAIGWAKNNSQFYAGGKSNQVHSFDSKGNILSMMYQMNGDVYDLEVSPDGENIAIVSGNGNAVVINSTTGTLVADLWNTSNGGVFEVAWTNDGSKLILGGYDRIARWYHTSNWTEERNFTMSGWISGIDTTPDDRIIFMSSSSTLSAIWSSNGTFIYDMTDHSGYIRSVVVSPDGRYVATGSEDNTIKITSIANGTVIKTINAGHDVYSVDFSPDGGTLIAARGYNITGILAYSTDTWGSLGEMEGFGSNNRNSGVFSLNFNEDGSKIAVGWRRGYTSVQMTADAYIRVHGDHYTALMENSWVSSFPTVDDSVRFWEMDRVTTTTDVCDSEKYIGSSTNGVSPQYAVKDSNYSTNGLWHCKYTNETILEIPYGRAAGAFVVKSGGATETCLESIGGLSMAQVRWISSGQTKTTMTTDAEMPGLVWSSVVPNDDGNGVPEWRDLDSSCPDTEIVLTHRWENRTDTTILKETVLCENCAQKDSLYSSTTSRYRAIAGEFRSDVTLGVAASGGEGLIGFTELVYIVDDASGYVVPLIDNYTHGIVDAIADGGVAINASLNSSKSGEWPLQTDMRAFIATSRISENIEFLKFLLSDLGQIKWEQMGFVGLSPWALYNSWAKLGVDMSYLLPDADDDGVWDGSDDCPNTELGLITDLNGCAENQLDNDSDGFTNDLDDCADVFGTSTIILVGCPDADGDGWPDVEDSHPGDTSEWNDTDMDGFGDNSDDCIDVFGNSSNDLVGCEDSDGDGWSESGDSFPDDPTEWVDSDGDGYGDNSDIFPYENTQWIDSDGDGFGDNNSGLEGDDCLNVSGTSHEDGLFGCLDSDSDGWADTIDDLPSNPEQNRDEDGDGVGDSVSVGDYDWCIETPLDEISMVDSSGCSPSERDTDYDSFTDDIDQCPNTPIAQSAQVNTTRFLDSSNTVLNPIIGCAPSEIDADGDSVTSDLDWDDNNPDQWLDSDGDGFGDNSNVEGGDDCPTQEGYSYKDQFGCLDLDSDGWSYDGDFNDGDSTQWNDSDGDGFGDNWDDPSWNESRLYGEFVPGATQPDRCPDVYSEFLYSDYEGCMTSVVESNEDISDETSSSEDEDSNLMLIIGIAASGIVFILFGSIAVLLKKKPAPKGRSVQKEDSTESEVLNETSGSEAEFSESTDFVANWEDLPPGDWLPTDENGVNWYKDNDGRHWYSDSDGYHIWNQ
jgi:WD40 repeat protein